MGKAIHLNKNLFIFGIPLSLFGLLVFLMSSSFLKGNTTMELAITVDLLITVPFIYFLLIRKTQIPKTTVIPLMVIGLFIGSCFLPTESQTYLSIFKTWALPIIELLVLSFVVIKVRAAVKSYKQLKDASPDFYSTLISVCRQILPKKLVMPFATEIAVLYYGFINWKSLPLQENEFSYHKKSGTPALFGAFVFIIIIETLAFHFLLARWSILAAWILTGLSVYTAVQVFGFAKSLSQRPISINASSLTLRYGILNEVEIPFENIDSMELSQSTLEKDPFTKTLSPLGELESHNLVIRLKSSSYLIGLYGMKKEFKVLGLYVDEPGDFKERMEEVMRS